MRQRAGCFAIASIYLCGIIGCSYSRNENTNSAPSKPAASSHPARLTGSSFQSDPSGDVRDGNDVKSKQMLPGADLTNVKLEAVDSGLSITFTASSEFPQSGAGNQSAIWSINACTPDGNRCLSISAKVVGSEWMAFTFDMKTSRNTYISAPTIKGKDLSITVAQDKLPDWMSQPFKWRADSEWDGKWKDQVPDEGKDILNPPTVPFPK